MPTAVSVQRRHQGIADEAVSELRDALSDAVATACASAAHIGQYGIMDYANSLTQDDNERRKITSELIKRTGGF